MTVFVRWSSLRTRCVVSLHLFLCEGCRLCAGDSKELNFSGTVKEMSICTVRPKRATAQNLDLEIAYR